MDSFTYLVSEDNQFTKLISVYKIVKLFRTHYFLSLHIKMVLGCSHIN